MDCENGIINTLKINKMAYLITCSGSKQKPTIINPSSIENLSFNEELLEVRKQMIQISNISLDWNRTLPAWQLYKGKRSKLYPKVSDYNWVNPKSDIRILSALFGWINHTDLIPYYDLAMTDKINGCFVWKMWSNFNLLNNNIDTDNNVDLLSISYRKAINNNGNFVAQVPNINWRDKYGCHKGEWLNEQLNNK